MAGPVKTFHSVQALGEWYNNEVFRAIHDDSLLVRDDRAHCWYRYRWSRGQREVKFVARHEGELPIVVQVYP